MSFFTGLIDAVSNAAQARVRVEAQRRARRAQGKQPRMAGCGPCSANAAVMARYEANEAAQKAARRR